MGRGRFQCAEEPPKLFMGRLTVRMGGAVHWPLHSDESLERTLLLRFYSGEIQGVMPCSVSRVRILSLPYPYPQSRPPSHLADPCVVT